MADAAAALSLCLALFFLSSATTPATSSATPRPVGARANNITLGSSLSTTAATPASTSSWLSPSARFAFGFYPVPGGFAVGVWLATSPNITVLWTAFRDEPPFTSATLTLLLDGQLHLTSTSGARRDKVISGTKHGSYASMLDTGELVIYDKEGRPVWSTSDLPTDTILAGQTLRPGQELVSASNNNFSTRGFRLKMQRDCNLVLYPVDTDDTEYYAYWASGTYHFGTDVSLSLKLDSQGCLFLSPDLPSNYTRVNLTDAQPSRPSNSHGRVATAEVYYRATLDVDGVLRLYSHTFFRGSSTSTAVVWRAPVDACNVKGACGFNSYRDTSPGGGAPDCLCPPGFRFIDPGKRSAGCERNFTTVGCDGGGGAAATAARGLTMTALSVAWVESVYSVSASARAEDCKAACLADCSCDAALFRGGKCLKQTVPLQYGHRSAGVQTFFKDGSAVDPRTSIHPDIRRRSNIKIILGITTGGSGLLLACIILCCLRYKKKSNPCPLWAMKSRDSHNIEAFLEQYGSTVPKRYRYSEVKKMTKSFSDKLGQGGFGAVFKGKLQDGQLVAVKVLNKSNESGEDFINEVASIGRTQHINIVRLLGFCYERSKRALLYEFMPNGSLEKFIFSTKQSDTTLLGWEKLLEISIGIAHGLEYLHRRCNTRIVHFDIKPHNILLDEDFCPKISDFGLAKTCHPNQSILSRAETRGTIGYIAPEVFSRKFGVISSKSDVYSYGMMVLEMVGGRNNLDTGMDNTSEIYFPHWIYEHFNEDDGLKFCGITSETEYVARKMIIVGLWCIQTSPSVRPSMTNVVEMLEGKNEDLSMPPKPYLCSP